MTAPSASKITTPNSALQYLLSSEAPSTLSAPARQVCSHVVVADATARLLYTVAMRSRRRSSMQRYRWSGSLERATGSVFLTSDAEHAGLTSSESTPTTSRAQNDFAPEIWHCAALAHVRALAPDVERIKTRARSLMHRGEQGLKRSVPRPLDCFRASFPCARRLCRAPSQRSFSPIFRAASFHGSTRRCTRGCERSMNWRGM